MDLGIETPCTCGHPASSHNKLGVCFAAVGVVWCNCNDFTSDDTAVAAAAGVLVENPTAVTTR